MICIANGDARVRGVTRGADCSHAPMHLPVSRCQQCQTASRPCMPSSRRNLQVARPTVAAHSAYVCQGDDVHV